MLAERQIVSADVLAKVLTLPRAFEHHKLEVVVWPVDDITDNASGYTMMTTDDALDMTDEVIGKYRPALEELAK
jgi:hypothetical protein